MAEDFLGALLRIMIDSGTPLLLATLGEIIVERSGILNLGIEGMMIVGAVVAFGTTLTTGNLLLGVVIAIVASGLLALIHGFLSITLKQNQIVSGLALAMFGVGLSGFIGKPFIGVPLPNHFYPIPIPVLSSIPIIGPFLFQHDMLVYISYGMTPLLWFILFKTKAGINIRSVGENPIAADMLGVNVVLTRYICVFFGGAMAGLGGAYLSLSYTTAWIEGMTVGRGWIAVALAVFSMWNPWRALVGSYLFGGIEALQFSLQSYGVSRYFLAMLPYAFTIIVVFIATLQVIRKRIGAPAALGTPYTREGE